MLRPEGGRGVRPAAAATAGGLTRGSAVSVGTISPQSWWGSGCAPIAVTHGSVRSSWSEGRCSGLFASMRRRSCCSAGEACGGTVGSSSLIMRKTCAGG